MPLYVIGAPDGPEPALRVVARDETVARRAAERWRRLRSDWTTGREADPGATRRSRRWRRTAALWTTTVLVMIVAWRATDSAYVVGVLAVLAGVASVLLDVLLAEPTSEPFATYDRLVTASIHRRADEVIACAGRLAPSGGTTSLPPLMRFEVDMRCATAHWLLGRDEEAEACLRPHEVTDGSAREKDYRARRGSALLSAGLVDRGLAELARAETIVPRRAGDLLDRALWLARVGRPAEARQVLDEARELRGNLVTWAGRPFVTGVVAIEEGRAQDADRAFRSATRRLTWLPIGALRGAFEAEVSARQALAAAALGEHGRARALFARAAPFLEASGDLELAVRCAEAIAHAPA